MLKINVKWSSRLDHSGCNVVSKAVQRGEHGCGMRKVMTFALCVGTVAGL
jgi:hypothetical protein